MHFKREICKYRGLKVKVKGDLAMEFDSIRARGNLRPLLLLFYFRASVIDFSGSSSDA